jgi:hypothetical protein
VFTVTARLIVMLPFRISIKEGDLYETIEKKLNDTNLKIYPLEYMQTHTSTEKGNYVSNFRKIKIDVTMPVKSTTADFSDREIQRPFLDLATEYLNIFLAHCRAKSKQFWLHPIYLNYSNMSQIWYEVQYFENDGKILFKENGSTGGLHPFGVGICKEIWDKIKNDLNHDIKPSIIDYHIEEARNAVFSKNIEKLIVNIAIALEIFTSRFCHYYAKINGKDTDASFISIVESKDSFVVKNFKKLIPYLASKDLSAEKGNQYQFIDYLFRTRNKIVHEGEAYYKNDGGIKQIVDFEKSHEFFLSALSVLNWIRKIDTNIAEQLRYFVDKN